MKKYRIVNKVRFTTFLTAFILTTVISLSALFGYSDVAASNIPNYVEYYVESGDTLWDIAHEYAPENMNVKQFIYEICVHNDTDASHLQAGQVIEIPLYE